MFNFLENHNPSLIMKKNLTTNIRNIGASFHLLVP